jgi:hypothetical protein
VPVQGLIEAVGKAVDAIINSTSVEGFSIPSTTVIGKKNIYVVLGGTEKVLDEATRRGALYGAHNNYICVDGVSALWGGFISSDVIRPFVHNSLSSGSDALYSYSPDNFVTGNPQLVLIGDSGAEQACLDR